MRHTILKTTAGIVVAGALLAGCTGKSSGDPQPVTGDSSEQSSSSSNSNDQPSNGAPKVKSPFDTTKFADNPCSVLTQAQLQLLSIADPGKREDYGTFGPQCRWKETTTPQRLGFTIGAMVNHGGLSGIFAQRNEELVEQVPDIEGFPAVHYDPLSGRSSATGGCAYAVGTSDQVAFSIAASGTDRSNPCQWTRKVATLMMQTMKGGS
jgi:Protein of unknown function (DUF3558)